MRHFIALSAGLLLCAPALAQTPSTFAFKQPLSSAAVNGAFGGKADASGGILTDATRLGNRLSLDTMATCQSTMQLPTQSNLCIRLQAPVGVTFAANFGLTSSDATGEKVVLYTGAHATSGAGPMWSRNALLQIEPGSKGGQVDELDLNNSTCDPGNAENPAPACQIAAIGLLVTGLAYPYTAQSGIEVTTGQGQLWHQGLTFAGNSVRFANIWENTSAPYIMRMQGTHNYGLDFTGATIGGAAINFNTAKSGQSIVWNQGAATTGQFGIFGATDGSALNIFSPNGTVKVLSNGFLQAPQLVSLNNVVSGAGQGFITTLPNGAVQGAYLKTNAAGDVLFGSLVPAGGAKLDAGVLPITTTGPISTTNSISGSYIVATGALIVPISTPANSNVACTAGQTTVDVGFVYWCNATNHWLRAAGVAF